MEFKRTQCATTMNLIKWEVNGKSVTPTQYQDLEEEQKNQGKNYHNSLTTRDKNNNFTHQHNY